MTAENPRNPGKPLRIGSRFDERIGLEWSNREVSDSTSTRTQLHVRNSLTLDVQPNH